jgi:hypothetical protein
MPHRLERAECGIIYSPNNKENNMLRIVPIGVFACLTSVSVVAFAEDKPIGFLCCNMRTNGSWISDINYDDKGMKIIPVATPVAVTGYGRYRVKVDINGKHQAIGNDYSRDLPLDVFAKRYVVEDDPAAKIATFSKRAQDAIASARVAIGMTREQVLMSVGYPVSSENPNLGARTWKFWLSSFSEFHVSFDESDLVIEVSGDIDTKRQVFME